MTDSIRSVLLAPLRPRAWRELAYVVVGLLSAGLGFTVAILTLYLGALLSLTLVGLPLVAALLAAARPAGTVHRWLHRTLTGVAVPGPAPLRVRPGVLGWITGHLADAAGWRALAYVLLQLPAALLAAVVVVAFWLQGVVAVISPVLWAFDADRPLPGPFDSWPLPLALSALGVLAVLIAPHAVHLTVLLDRALMRWLLAPSEASERVQDLERTRALAVTDAAATLRRIERDLHDGAQARMVSLAMSLTAMDEQLRAPEPDPATLRMLVGQSRSAATEAIAELRDLVRGIHPPVLDSGLEPALRTLAASGPLPAEVCVRLDRRPDPAIETIAYFCCAELLTNVAKHAHASRCRIEIGSHRRRLRVRVQDDGVGGAVPRPGGGLSGLADRVGTVDGTLTVESPPGGPTSITVELPMAA